MVDVGERVGNYRVVAKLGEGSMGAVYLAEHPVIGRRAALKVIHERHVRNPEVVTRFVNEARAINEIGHEHIVEVTDFGRTARGDFYFIMEYLDGETLADWIRRLAPIEPTRALRVAAQIADALAASHAHQIVHRDLKPDNIFLMPRGDAVDFVKVLDFGLAKLLRGHRDVSSTRSGMIMGTPHYMAPEQCDGSASLDARADVYALGCVLFEMLTGEVPFPGEGAGEVIHAHLTKSAPAPSRLVPGLPPAIDALVARALAKPREERFSSMLELRAALLRAAAAPSNAPATFEPVVVDVDDTAPLAPARHPARRVLLVALAATAGIAVAGVRWRGLASPPEAPLAAAALAPPPLDPDAGVTPEEDGGAGADADALPLDAASPIAEAPRREDEAPRHPPHRSHVHRTAHAEPTPAPEPDWDEDNILAPSFMR
jgi:serine/threonine-protein kinase